MIPSSSLAYICVRFIGSNSLLSMAQSNLLTNIERVRKIRTHTFLSNNGQTATGVSRNEGAERYYCWEDTVIDCRNSPDLPESMYLADFPDSVAGNRRFQIFQEAIAERSNGLLRAEPFYTVIKGAENMRYNIKCDTKKRVEDFDTIRVGFKVTASSEGDFKKGLDSMRMWEKPFKVIGLDLVN